MGERLNGIQEVRGSIPLSSTSFLLRNLISVIAPAGSMAFFTSYDLHSSSTNTTDAMRRVYLAQYSSEPLVPLDGSRLWGSAEPFLIGGESAVGQPPPKPPFPVN